MNPELRHKLDEVLLRYEDIEAQLATSSVASNQNKLKLLGREHSGLRTLVELIRLHRNRSKDLEDTQSLLDDDDDDQEMHTLAKQEVAELKVQLGALEQRIKIELIPKDTTDTADAVLEVRAGTGGAEAALFAAELRRMYARYAERQNWKIVPIHAVETETGGIKEAVFEIVGKEAYARLKTESGVHRVQRVPTTESSGRLHTSAATVAVLPKAEEVDIQIDDGDIKTDVFHAGGHGGQNVNKVATAIRLTHLPSGIVVVCQNERSQLQNRLQAMGVLRTRLWESERQKKQMAQDAERRSQVGGGDRSEKIRTYNFPQSRITDHRIQFTTHRLQEVLDGGLGELIEALRAYAQAQKLGAAGC